jgi:TolB-like protein/DNA-binding winged helix-turn-helix (wHTH) protein/Tfp pilus assembly protein PilF
MAENLLTRRVSFSDFEVDLRSGELRKDGAKIRLQEKPFQILTLLLDQPGEVVTREEMRRKLWPADTFVDFDHSLGTAISKLRQALNDSPQNPRFIETIASRGYRFVGQAQEKGEPVVRPVAIPSDPVGEIVPTKRAPAAAPHRTWILIAVAGFSAGALLVAWFLGFDIGGVREWLRSETNRPVHSLAVLPFANSSADPNTEYLSDGITESLINSLSAVPNLKVTSRDSSFRYKGKDTDAPTVGRVLGVDAVFKGIIRQHGEKMDVSAELIDSRDNAHIWGEHYSPNSEDIFALQGEIAREITTALRMRLSGEDEKRMVKSSTTNPEAYLDYLKGRYWWNKLTLEGFNKSIEYFQQAIAKDPTYALAYSGLAVGYTQLSSFIPPMEVLPRAKEAALKAVELDDTSAEAHASLGIAKYKYDWDWPGAEKEYLRAIALNPGYEAAHRRYGLLLGEMGRFEEAIAELKRALELDPLSVIGNRELGYFGFYYARKYDQAIEQARKTQELDPNEGHVFLGAAYLQKSMYKEGIAEFEKALASSPNGIGYAIGPQTGLGYAYAVAGKRPEAQKVLDQLNQLSKQKYVSGVDLAIVYAGLGDKDKAFEYLERSYDDRSLGNLTGIKVDPVFDPLRSDPRFQDLLRRMNLQP